MASTSKVSHFIRRIGSTVAIGALLVPLGACSSRSPESPGSNERLPELRQLVSTINGLYYAPFLRADPAGSEDNAYALKIRQEIDEQPPRLSLSRKLVTSLHDDAVAASPLQGRAWLAPLVVAGADDLLTAVDVRAVRALRHADGSFLEPDVEDSEARRVVDTASALEILAARGVLTPDDRRTTGQWLTGVIQRTSSIRTAADAVRGLVLLELPVPAASAPVSRFTGDFGRLGQSERYEKLLDAYSVAVIAQARHEKPNIDPEVWQHVLATNVSELDFRDLFYLVTIAVADGASKSDLDPARDRLENESLPDGSVRNSNNFSGSAGNSIWALRLRRLAGEQVRDRAQVDALKKVARERASSSPAERLEANVALVLAGDDQARETVVRGCNAKVMLPGLVTEENVGTWSQVALACAESGTTVAPPTVQPWSTIDVPSVTAAATLVTGLADAGLPGSVPAWITRAQLREWAANPERVTSTRAYADVVRSFLILGGEMNSDITAAIGRSISTRKGCPQLPSLYRGDAQESGCDLKATWAVWKLQALIDPTHQSPTTNDSGKSK